MSGGSGGSGSGGRSGGGGAGTDGDAGQPGEVVRVAQLEKDLRSGKISLEDAQKKAREVYRAQADAFFKEKDYAKSARLTKEYEAIQEVTSRFEIAQAAKKPINWNKVTTKQGSSVRDDTASGGRVSRDKDFLDMMKRYRSP